MCQNFIRTSCLIAPNRVILLARSHRLQFQEVHTLRYSKFCIRGSHRLRCQSFRPPQKSRAYQRRATKRSRRRLSINGATSSSRNPSPALESTKQRRLPQLYRTYWRHSSPRPLRRYHVPPPLDPLALSSRHALTSPGALHAVFLSPGIPSGESNDPDHRHRSCMAHTPTFAIRILQFLHLGDRRKVYQPFRYY